MIVFKEYPKILQVAEAKKVVKQYNRLAQVLLEYELLYHQAWLKQVWTDILPTDRHSIAFFR